MESSGENSMNLRKMEVEELLNVLSIWNSTMKNSNHSLFVNSLSKIKSKDYNLFYKKLDLDRG